MPKSTKSKKIATAKPQKKQKRKKTSAVSRKALKKAVTKEKKVKKPRPKVEKKYYEAVGRRKRAVARVRIFTSSPSQSIGEGNFIINNKPYKEYFPTYNLQQIIEAPLRRLKSLNRFSGTVKVEGGGPTGQAEAVQHGLARALVIFDDNFKKKLKKSGYLTRDPRKKERKKFGLKGARRAPQWRKR